MRTKHIIAQDDVVELSEIKPGQMFSYGSSKYIKDDCLVRCSINLVTGELCNPEHFPASGYTLVHLVDYIILGRE